MNITEWLQAAPPALRVWLDSATVRRFIAEERRTLFQLQGTYDGSMSEDHQAILKQQYEAVSELSEGLGIARW